MSIRNKLRYKTIQQCCYCKINLSLEDIYLEQLQNSQDGWSFWACGWIFVRGGACSHKKKKSRGREQSASRWASPRLFKAWILLYPVDKYCQNLLICPKDSAFYPFNWDQVFILWNTLVQPWPLSLNLTNPSLRQLSFNWAYGVIVIVLVYNLFHTF